MSTARMRSIILLLSLLVCLLELVGCGGNDIAFTVNGVKVEKAELIYYMRENSSVVAAQLENEKGLDSTAEDFWTTPQNGIDAFDELRKYTESKIVRQKVEQLCAKDEGVDTPLYFSEQLKLLDEDNIKRAEAEKAGEVLYGPIKRDFVTYFSEWYLQMQYDCRLALINKGKLTVSQEEIENYYKLNISYFTSETKEDAFFRIREHLLDEKYSSYIDSLTQKAKIVEGNVEIDPNEVI